ncbi:MAG: hypothetical protein Q4F66_04605 [Clostridium sp.]|nr:hypothetical protein [Clostridium sp.]
MGNTNREMELANKSINLISEIVEEAEFFGENLLKNMRISSSAKEIVIEYMNKGTLEYSLSEVSNILTDSIEGLWKFGESFEDSINTICRRKNDNYGSIEKKEFIEYAGRAEYVKFRLEEILNILREIEKII